MKVILSAAVSLDGFLDDVSAKPLRLSCEADLAEVDRLRAESDAILVGAETVRADDPSLSSRNDAAIEIRRRLGKPPDPIKVTLTRTGRFDVGSRFFTTGNGAKIVFCARSAPADLERRLAGLAEVARANGDDASATFVIDALNRRGVDQLLVEGGARILTMFLRSGRANAVRLAVAPLVLGRCGKTRFLDAEDFSALDDGGLTLRSAEKVGRTAVLWFDLLPSPS